MPTSRLTPAPDQQVIVVCDSAAITAGDISGVLTALKSLTGDRSSTMSAEGAVTLVCQRDALLADSIKPLVAA